MTEISEQPAQDLAGFLPRVEADIAEVDRLAERVRAEIGARKAHVAALDAESARLRVTRAYFAANPGMTADDVRAEVERLDAAMVPAQAEVARCEAGLAAAVRRLQDAEAVAAFLRAHVPDGG
jgi:hypothetical protein